MKANSIIRTIVLSMVTVFTLSCSEDFFEQQAGNRIKPDQHYQSITDVLMSLYGSIIPMQEIMPNLIMIDGLRSDIMDVTPNASSYLNELNDHTFSVSNPYLDFSGLYKSIINLNEVLINLPRVYENDPNFDDFFMKYITGGIIGMRAWTYLTLSRIYGKVAWIPDNLTSLPDGLNQSYMTKEALIDTLISQITPYIHTDDLLVELQIPYYMNTKALLGELYLEKNDYANAVLYLKMACESYANSSSIYKVDRTFARLSWLNIFIASENNFSEVISAIPYS